MFVCSQFKRRWHLAQNLFLESDGGRALSRVQLAHILLKMLLHQRFPDYYPHKFLGDLFFACAEKKRSYKFPFIFWMVPWSLGKKIIYDILAFINFHTLRSFFFLNPFKVLQLSTHLQIQWVIIRDCTLRRFNLFVVRIFRGQKWRGMPILFDCKGGRGG